MSIYKMHQSLYKIVLFCLHTNLDAGKLLAPKTKSVFTVSIIEANSRKLARQIWHNLSVD